MFGIVSECVVSSQQPFGVTAFDPQLERMESLVGMTGFIACETNVRIVQEAGFTGGNSNL